MRRSGRSQFLGGATDSQGKKLSSPPDTCEAPRAAGSRVMTGWPPWAWRSLQMCLARPPCPGAPVVSRWPATAPRMGFRAPVFFLSATWPLAFPWEKLGPEPGQHSLLWYLLCAHSVLPCSFPWVPSTLKGTGPYWFHGKESPGGPPRLPYS